MTLLDLLVLAALAYVGFRVGVHLTRLEPARVPIAPGSGPYAPLPTSGRRRGSSSAPSSTVCMYVNPDLAPLLGTGGPRFGPPPPSVRIEGDTPTTRRLTD